MKTSIVELGLLGVTFLVIYIVYLIVLPICGVEGTQYYFELSCGVIIGVLIILLCDEIGIIDL
jgi:hypothetical protein